MDEPRASIFTDPPEYGPHCYWCSEPITLPLRSACCPDVCHPCVVAGSHGDQCEEYTGPEPDYNAPTAAERLEMAHRGKR